MEHVELQRIDERFNLEKELVRLEFDKIEQATVLQAKEYERRLEALNHAHERAREIQATYLRRESFETFMAQNTRNLQRVDETLLDLRQSLVPVELYNEKHDLLVARVDELKAAEVRREGASEGLTATARFIVATVGLVGAVVSLVVLLSNNII